MAASTESLNYVQKMFIAFLGRAGAPEGMEYYAALIDADEESGKAILFDDLFYSDQGQALYAGKETYEIVDIIFNNVMGRSPETAGLIYWTNAIDDGDFNVAEAAAIIADSAANNADDLAELNAKTTAADAVTQELTDNPDSVAGYQENFDLARDSLGDVTAANVGSFDAASEVNAISNGYASSTTLSTGNDTVVGTEDFVDTVTGTVGTGATYGTSGTNTDSITDPDSGDGDILNLSGDDDFAASVVSGFENINLDLGKQDGTAFAISSVGNDVETIDLTVAETVDVVGITVDGETAATIAGDLTAAITTTNVTSLTATTTGAGAYSITGDADLATVSTVDSNDAGVSITLSAAATSVTVDGADGTNDAATISAVGEVALDVSAGANDVDLLTLSGNGAAVTYTLTNAGSDTEYTITGDQDVTLAGANDAFDGSSFTDSSTGSTTIEITSGGDTNLEAAGVLSGGINVSAALTAGTLTVATGNTVTLSADQTGNLTIDGNDTTAGGEISLVMSNDSSANITFADYETVSVNAGANAASVVDLATGTNDTLNIAGTSSFTADDVTAGAIGVSMSGAFTANDVTSTFLTGDSSISITADDITTNDIAVSSNDSLELTATGNDIEVTTVDAGTGAVTMGAAGDITTTTVAGGVIDIDAAGDLETTTVSGTTVTLEGDDVTVGAITGSSVSITSTNDATASTLVGIDSTGDITITGGTWTQATAGGNINANDGTLTIDSADVTITGTNDVWASSIVVTGGNDVDLGDQVNTSVVNGTAATGDIDMTIDANDSAAGVTVQTGAGDDDITLNQLATIFNATLGDGNDVLTITTSNKVTANTGAGDDTVNIDNANDTLTLNTAEGEDLVEINSGGIDGVTTISTGADNDTVNIDAGSVGAALTVNTEGGADTVQIDDTGNDVTVNAGAGDDGITVAIDAAANVNAGADDDTITLSGDSNAVIDGGDGSDTLVLAGNDYTDSDLSFSGIEVVNIAGAGNDAVLSDDQFAADNTFNLLGTGNATLNFLTILADSTNDTTIDASGVTVTQFSEGTLHITGNDGDDTLTDNAWSGIISGGAGNDTIDGGAGQDNIDGGTGADSMTGGADADTFVIGTGDNDVGIDATNDAMDTITDFQTTVDTVDITAFSLAENTSNDTDGSGANDVGEVLALAQAMIAADNDDSVFIVTDAMGTGDSYVYIDVDNDGDLDDDDILIIFTDATPVISDFDI
ncbi:calcium-binding protein [Luminiphilus sp.]|nr:calcium-binding protein [Luminiphilus sp.]